MADDRLPWRRSASIEATSSESVWLRVAAISLSPLQNASSRLTLVLCPVMTIERLTTGDFIRRLPYRSCDHRDADASSRRALHPRPVALSSGHEPRGSQQRVQRPVVSWLVCGLFSG